MRKFFALLILCTPLFFFAACSQSKKTSAPLDSAAVSVVNTAAAKAQEKEQERQKELSQKAEQDTHLNFWSDYPADILASVIVKRMTNDELLAQLLMFGWAGEAPNALVVEWVADRALGSVKVFGWNTDDVHSVAKGVISLQEKAAKTRFKIPLYVATDQEGGWIRHVKGTTSDTPGNLAIGASGYPIDSWYSGYYIGRELRALGINMNFAPTVDLYTNHDSTVIGARSFGEDALSSGVLGASFAAGSMAAGVIPTAKHFPGHGDTGLDSHGRLPLIDIDKKTLLNRELVPFKYLIAEHIPAIMSGHLGFPKILGSEVPASLSKVFLRDILRKELGYTGLIISDDMMMNGATIYAGNMSTAFRMAIEAGNQIICSSTTPQLNEALWRNNVQLMGTSSEFRSIVMEAVYGVLLSKLNYFKGENAVAIYPDLGKIDSLVPDPEGKAFFIEQACRSITLYRDKNFPLPAEKTGKTLLAGQFQQFFDAGKKRYPNADTYFFKYFIGPNETEWHGETLAAMVRRSYDTVVICVANDESAKIAQALKSCGKKVVIISSLAPVYVMGKFTWTDAVLLTYSYSHYSYIAAFAALSGDFVPQGVLPLKEN